RHRRDAGIDEGYRRNEAVAAFRHSLDVASVLTFVAERLADLRNRAREDIRRHEGAFPHRVEQLFLRDHPIPMLDQMDEDVEGLWFKRDSGVATDRRHAAHVHADLAEFVDRA